MEFEILNSEIPEHIYRSLNLEEMPKLVQFDNMAMLEINDTPPDHFPPPLTVTELQLAYSRGDIFGGIVDAAGELKSYFWFEPKVDELYVSSMAVHPDYRNKGISQQILAIADNEARKRSLNKCTLSVDPYNGRGISAYFKNGYRIVGYRAEYFGSEYPNTDRFLMEKLLDGGRRVGVEIANVECDDTITLNRVLTDGFIGMSLIRSEDGNDKKNKIIFGK